MTVFWLRLTPIALPEALWWISVHGIYRPCSFVAANLDAGIA
ncbi:hypothetical protein [Mycobacterium xenopi]|nr:hypothetical protein [Mycobacterium xenopi]